jgi:hypothetical protein
MAAKGKAGTGGGCTTILGLTLLVFTLGWPLFAFHRHWTTTRVINCATDYGAAITANGCTYDYNSGNYSGTGIVTTTHSAISAAGWIAQVVWIGVLVGGLALLARSSSRKQKVAAVAKGTVFASGKGPRTVHDVIDPGLPANQRNPASLAADHVVKSSTLDTAGKMVLARVQQAIKDVLTSGVYADDQLERAVAEPTLRRHEWAVAVDLREITKLRNEQDRVRRSHAGSDPGPLTKSVIAAQEEALQQKLNKIESIATAMEKYAGHVKAADRARKDWQSAAELAKLNVKFTDLIAGTAADELHLREVEDMTEEANAFRESLTEANLAARSLFLPDTAADHDD